MSDTNLSDMFDVIYTYTRKQAIEDGVLIDVSETAREAGITFPVAVTSTVWGGYIEPPDRLDGRGQSTSGRLWDTLWMFRIAARGQTARGHSGDLLKYDVGFLMPSDDPTAKPATRIVTLKAHCGPGDDGEPVITIMLPDED